VLAVSAYDLDAPISSSYWYWVAFNIPSNGTALYRCGSRFSPSL
jgi:phosphatidylethanolamine-binding protein (PEBP) family uncharacterized protein